VAKAILSLIDTPAGKRPARAVVALAFGADGANGAIEPFQAQLISGLGFDRLTKLSVA
jgi:hypothetical protein